jgi:hypothetical protein
MKKLFSPASLFMNRKRHVLMVFIAIFVILPLSLAQGQVGTEAGIFLAYAVDVGERVDVPLEIRNVQNIYAIDVRLQFDPAVLSVDDADPSTPGVQVALGAFLSPDLVLFNLVDLDAGTVNLVLSQVNPTQPKTGSGTILTVYFRGITDGESALTITSLALSDRDGMDIPASVVNSALIVGNGAPEMIRYYLPLVMLNFNQRIDNERRYLSLNWIRVQINNEITPANNKVE